MKIFIEFELLFGKFGDLGLSGGGNEKYFLFQKPVVTNRVWFPVFLNSFGEHLQKEGSILDNLKNVALYVNDWKQPKKEKKNDFIVVTFQNEPLSEKIFISAAE